MTTYFSFWLIRRLTLVLAFLCSQSYPSTIADKNCYLGPICRANNLQETFIVSISTFPLMTGIVRAYVKRSSDLHLEAKHLIPRGKLSLLLARLEEEKRKKKEEKREKKRNENSSNWKGSMIRSLVWQAAAGRAAKIEKQILGALRKKVARVSGVGLQMNLPSSSGGRGGWVAVEVDGALWGGREGVFSEVGSHCHEKYEGTSFGRDPPSRILAPGHYVDKYVCLCSRAHKPRDHDRARTQSRYTNVYMCTCVHARVCVCV